MNRRHRRGVFLLTLFLGGAFGGSSGWAQTQEAAKPKLAEAQKQNSAQLRLYGWRSRTEFKVRGETRGVTLATVRYDSDGRLQKRVIESTPPEPNELMVRLQQFAESYAHMTPEQIRVMAMAAAISEGQGSMAGTTAIVGANAVVSGDTVAIWADESSFLIRRIRVNSPFESNPVNLTIEYQNLPGGPAYPARIELTYAKEGMQISIQNTTYQLLPTAGASR